MMIKKITQLLGLLVLSGILWSGPAQAQDRKLKKADKDYQKLEYVNAQEIYLKVAKKGYASVELFSKLGNTYYFTAKYEQAAHWYKRLFALNEKPDKTILYLRYAQSLRAIGKNKAAQKYFDLYQKKAHLDTYKSAIDYLKLIEENSGRYQLRLLDKLYDSLQISFGHTVYKHHLIYTSTTKEPLSFYNRIDAWDGLSFTSLYKVKVDSLNRVVGKPQRLKDVFKSKFHDASATFTADGKTVYFTRNNMTATTKKDAKNLKIYRSFYQNDEWQEPKELSIDGDTFSTAHPALSPDETKLYFASNRPGGFGQSDLYVVEIHADGTLGEPKNLGNTINTPGRETFPFVSQDQILYFSSDGHYGLGGLDVYAINLDSDGDYGHLLNVGRPINSYADDFSYGINTETRYGFVSSDRGRYSDTVLVRSNIYSFKEDRPLKDVYKAVIEGYVTDKDSGDPIANATITLRDKEGQVVGQIMTDENGYYKTEIERFQTYAIRAEKQDYDTDEKMSKPGLAHQRIDFQLKRNRVALMPGMDLAKILNIPRIYFDFDKYNIRKPDATRDLAKVYEVLVEYPNLRLKIRSHTDSRGSDAYNQALSQRRAKSTKAWLVKQGINANRLETEGVGEREITNGCTNGVPCTKAQHQANRRSEFIVIE